MRSTIASDGMKNPAQSLRNMIDEADLLMRSAARQGDEKLEELLDKFSAQVHELRAQLDDAEEDALNRAKATLRAADRKVRAKPYAAIGVAAAAGLLIGLLFSRR